MQLWRGFTAEVDLLYRHNGSSLSYNYAPLSPTGEPVSPPFFVASRTRMEVFELPVLGKYYFRRESNLQPFVLTGYSFRKGKTHVDNSVTTEGRTTSGESSGWSDLDIGASFGLGLRYRLGRVSLSPEVRYTEWGGQPSRIVSKRQADFLFGITF